MAAIMMPTMGLMVSKISRKSFISIAYPTAKDESEPDSHLSPLSEHP